MKNMIFILVSSFSIAIWSVSPPVKAATLVGCDGCSAQQMLMKAESRGLSHGAGTHELEVLNVSNAKYQKYVVQIERGNSTRGKSTELSVTTQAVASSNKVSVEADLADVRTSIDNIKSYLRGKIELPSNTPYRSAADALKYRDDFSAYLTNYLVNEQSTVLNNITNLSKVLQSLANKLNITVGAVVSVSTSLNLAAYSTTTFPDGTSMQVGVKIGHHISDGIQLIIKATQRAHTGDGTKIPSNPLEANGFRGLASHINPVSLAAWLKEIGMIIRGPEGGGSCETVSIECRSNKECEYVLRCQ